MPGQEAAQPPQAAAELACLLRAAALPASHRSPEAAAMLEAARLAEQIHALLPVGADGGAALPDSPAVRQRALRAMLKASCRSGRLLSCAVVSLAVSARQILCSSEQQQGRCVPKLP